MLLYLIDNSLRNDTFNDKKNNILECLAFLLEINFILFRNNEQNIFL